MHTYRAVLDDNQNYRPRLNMPAAYLAKYDVRSDDNGNLEVSVIIPINMKLSAPPVVFRSCVPSSLCPPPPPPKRATPSQIKRSQSPPPPPPPPPSKTTSPPKRKRVPPPPCMRDYIILPCGTELVACDYSSGNLIWKKTMNDVIQRLSFGNAQIFVHTTGKKHVYSLSGTLVQTLTEEDTDCLNA